MLKFVCPFALWLIIGCQSVEPLSALERGRIRTVLENTLDAWHRAAATADEELFFGTMSADGIYIGTDAGEYWLRDEMKAWSVQYFDRDSAWVFHPRSRNIYVDDTGSIAWFDELLDTWMGVCRGSGVLQKQADNTWKLKHYHLSIAVPNEVVPDYLKLIGMPQR